MGENATDMTYLKNIIVKLLETGEFAALLPVVATLLKLSPDEVARVRRYYEKTAGDNTPMPVAAHAVDQAAEASSAGTAWLSSLWGS